MRLSASRSCLVAGAKPRRVLPRVGAITSRFDSLEKLWRRRDERTSFGPSRRDSDPRLSCAAFSPKFVACWAMFSTCETRHASELVAALVAISAVRCGTEDDDYRREQIGRASCREECRSRWSPYH